MLDGIVLIVSLVATLTTLDLTDGLSLIILFVVLHFFLFCNVFRIRRKPELIWAATFIANCALWLVFGEFNLTWIALTQSVITICLILFEVRLPYYHGVFAKRINPKLDDYLFGRLENTQNAG